MKLGLRLRILDKAIKCASIVGSLTSLFLILWYIYYSRTSSKITSLVTLVEPLELFSDQFASCWTAPEEIKSWIGNELVTAVQPPVEADCELLKEGNFTEQERVLNGQKNWTNNETVDEFYTNIQNCSYVKNLLSGNNFYISATELNFSLAYAMLFHGSPQQIFRLLRVIYRPHNVYCLHPDGKANETLIESFRQMASCFDNIFVPDELVNVTYMHFSMVDAQLKCLHDLVYHYQHFQWKYANILCGKELPFNSNRVLVEKLKELNGDSVVNVDRISYYHHEHRFKYYYGVKDGKLEKMGERKEKLPFGLPLYISVNYISASRQFAIFLLTSPRVKALHHYMSTALMADELFFATAYMMPEAPTTGEQYHSVFLVKTFFLVLKKCGGKQVHSSCILNVRDIPLLHNYNSKRKNTTVMFYNKYFMEYDHVVMDCMEKRIVEQNKLEYERDCMP